MQNDPNSFTSWLGFPSFNIRQKEENLQIPEHFLIEPACQTMDTTFLSDFISQVKDLMEQKDFQKVRQTIVAVLPNVFI